MKPIKFNLICLILSGVISMAFIKSNVLRTGNDDDEKSRFYGEYIAVSKKKNVIPPAFPGGENKLFWYIEDNFSFNDSALDYNIYGDAWVKFTVSKAGEIANIKFEDEGSADMVIFKKFGLLDELKRVLSLSPKWKPAQRKGKNVPFEIRLKVYMTPHYDIDFEEEYEYEIIAPPPPPELIERDYTNDIFQVVEDMPSYPGGIDSMIAFIDKHFIYPVDAKKNQIEGRVLMSFVVNKEGKLSDIKPLLPESRRLGFGLEEEAIRVISLMPDWIPGKQRNKPVNVQYILPIRCQLNK